MIQLKSKSLLASDNFILSNSEFIILTLFADHIDDFYEISRLPVKRRLYIEELQAEEERKNLGSFSIQTGASIPFGEENFYSVSPTLGLAFQGSLNNKFVLELGYKFRAGKAKHNLRYYDGPIVESKNKHAHALLFGIGFKAYEKNRFILLPKISSGVNLIWTGSKTLGTSIDDNGDEYESTSYKNIVTWQNNLGLSILYKVNNRQYLGVDLTYNFIPYNWDNRLVSKVERHYLNFELSFKF